MKKYWKELLIFILQMLLFYIFPLFAGPTDAMGMVVLMLAGTCLLGFLMGAFSAKFVKFLYPPVVAVMFLPTILLYYNESAWIHAVWYFVMAAGGLLLGIFNRRVFKM